MDQPKIERLLRLMKMMTTNTTYSVDDMAERLDMSRRTIYRYIDTFREAGFVIKKSGNYIRIDKESPHFKDISQLVHFTEEEAVILKRAIESIDNTNLLKQNLKRKLYSVYDNKILADTIVQGEAAATVHSLIEAIENKQTVILHDYRSAHGSAVRDRKVEPFAFTTNYVQAWCYDTESNSCKLFKISRIGSVEVLNQRWQYAEQHRKGFIDIFRMTSNSEQHPHIRLSLGLLARNLLVEEYPLAEQYLQQEEGSERWILDVDVANYAGAARFVVGLMDDIRIIDSPEFENYLTSYIERFWPQAISK
jgi:predicted DNA-binding transcriptional regulator YafY